MKKAIQVDEKDNVATSTSDLENGERIEVLSPEGEVITTPTISDAVPFGHKIALTDFNKGDQVIKYGEVIGIASQPIKTGEWIHIHNIESLTVPTSAYKEDNPHD